MNKRVKSGNKGVMVRLWMSPRLKNALEKYAEHKETSMSHELRQAAKKIVGLK